MRPPEASAAVSPLSVSRGIHGQGISRALEHRLGIGERNGGSFVLGEGPRTASRWKAVLAWIEELATQQDCSDAIVEAAGETFPATARWFKREKRHACATKRHHLSSI